MRIKHSYQKEHEGNIECMFCPRKYKNRVDCENHMKANHDYDAVAIRQKEREETRIRKLEEAHVLKEEKQGRFYQFEDNIYYSFWFVDNNHVVK